MTILQRRFALIRRCALGVLIAVPLIFAQGTQPQAALVYDESTDGDLTSAATLMFSAGSNAVSGSSEFFQNPFTIDQDPFFFVIPTDHSLTSVSVTISNFARFADSSFEAANYIIFGLPSLQLGIFLASASSSSLPIFMSGLPKPADTYQWGNGLGFNGSASGTGFSYDYTLTFDVSPVPLPAALPLFGSALAMLGIVGWRRRRQEAGA